MKALVDGEGSKGRGGKRRRGEGRERTRQNYSLIPKVQSIKGKIAKLDGIRINFLLLCRRSC